MNIELFQNLLLKLFHMGNGQYLNGEKYDSSFPGFVLNIIKVDKPQIDQHCARTHLHFLLFLDTRCHRLNSLLMEDMTFNFYPRPIRAVWYYCALRRLYVCPSVRPALVTTLHHTIFNGSYSYLAQPMTLVIVQIFLLLWGFYVHF